MVNRSEEIIGDREKTISDDLASAEQANAKAAELLAQYEEKLGQARADASSAVRTVMEEADKKAIAAENRVAKKIIKQTAEADDRIRAALSDAQADLADSAAVTAQSAVARLAGLKVTKTVAKNAVSECLRCKVSCPPPLFAAENSILVDWLISSDTAVMLALILFLGIAYRYGWPMIRDMIDGQIKAVKDELDEAKRLREEAAALLSEYEEKHQKALKEAEAIVKAAEEDAEALRDKAEAALKDSLKRREAAAKARIQQAEASAIADAQAAAAANAIAAAEKMLSEKMDAQADGALISEAIGLVPGRLN